ncbi:MAG: glutathione peroxidase [Alkalibacterium sp.]|nr:glutathione peroxidase [Alkalibacterium sp.]
MSMYETEVITIDGNATDLSEYKDNWLLIVNTASKCGLVNQLEGLEYLYKKYKDKGLIVLGFPCDQFMGQEPLNSEGIKQFCSMNFNVTFPLFEKIKVNGSGAHPLFQHLKRETGGKSVKWNFTKFLINPEDESVIRFAPVTTPDKIEKELIHCLGDN